MTYKLGQLLKLENAYYIVHQLSDYGYPKAVFSADKYGNKVSKTIHSTNNKKGWHDIRFEIVEPMDPKHAKYEAVISKIKQLDARFEQKQARKKYNAKAVKDVFDSYVFSTASTGTWVTDATISTTVSW